MDVFEQGILEERKAGYAALVELERASLKIVTLVNGGAAVALLAFLGNVWGKSNGQNPALVAGNIRWAMVLFVIGVFSGASGTVASYIASHISNQRRKDTWSSSFANRISNLLIVVGLLAFLTGSVLAVFALT